MNMRQSLFIFLCILLSHIQTTSAETIIRLTSDPWPPYIIGTLGNEATGGTGIAVIKKIFDRVDGASVALPLLPWNRGLKQVKEGSLDGIQLLRKTAEREAYMVFSDTVFISRELIWYSRERFPNGFEWQTIEDLKPYTLGMVSGYSYSEEMDKAVADKQLTAVKAADNELIFSMLAKGRVDLILASESVGRLLIKKHGHAMIADSKKAVVEEPHYMGFSKKTAAKSFIPAINNAIKALNDEGIIDSIMYQ